MVLDKVKLYIIIFFNILSIPISMLWGFDKIKSVLFLVINIVIFSWTIVDLDYKNKTQKIDKQIKEPINRNNTKNHFEEQLKKQKKHEFKRTINKHPEFIYVALDELNINDDKIKERIESHFVLNKLNEE
jgi:hypothetical protein